MSALILVRGFWDCGEMSGRPYKTRECTALLKCNVTRGLIYTESSAGKPASSCLYIVGSAREPRHRVTLTRTPKTTAVSPKTGMNNLAMGQYELRGLGASVPDWLVSPVGTAAVSLPAAWPAGENQGPLKACYIGTYGPCPCPFVPLPRCSPTLSPKLVSVPP